MPRYSKSLMGKHMPEPPGLPSIFGAGIWLVTDDNFWENNDGFTWADPIWVPSGSDGQLDVIGTWAVGFRPIAFRIISDDPEYEIGMRDTNGDSVLDGDIGGDYSGVWLPLAFGSYNIDNVYFDDIDAMTEITKIEFK